MLTETNCRRALFRTTLPEPLTALQREERARPTGAFVALLALGISCVSKASEPRAAPMMLVAYSNALAGSALVSGDYESAMKTLQDRRSSVNTDTVTLETNRCVAFTATGHLSEARRACDTAVNDAQTPGSTFSVASAWSTGWSPGASDRALAFSNRAVLESLSGDRAAAERDLERARALDPKADFVARNLAVLRDRAEAVAGSRTPPVAAGLAPPHL